MMEIEYIPLKTTDGRICGYARIRGGSAEIRLRPPQDGRVLVFTESGVADGVPDARIPLSAQAAAVALHENGTLRCCGFSRTTAMNLSELRRRVRALAPESAPRGAGNTDGRKSIGGTAGNAARGVGDADGRKSIGGTAGNAARGVGDAETFGGKPGSAARGAGDATEPAKSVAGKPGSAARGAGDAEAFGGTVGSAAHGATDTEAFAGKPGSAARGAGDAEKSAFPGADADAAVLQRQSAAESRLLRGGAGNTDGRKSIGGTAGNAARGAGDAETFAGKPGSAARGASDAAEPAKSIAGKTDSAESSVAEMRDAAKREKDADTAAWFFADGADADGDSLSRAALYARAERMLRRLAALTDPGTAAEEPMFAPAQEPAKSDAAEDASRPRNTRNVSLDVAARTADAPSDPWKAPTQTAGRTADAPHNARNVSLDAAARTADAPSDPWKAPAQTAARTADAPRNARNVSLDAAARTADAPSDPWKAPAQTAGRTADAAEAAPAEAFESAIPTVGDLPYGRTDGDDPLRLPEHDSAPAPEQTSVPNPFPHIFPGAAFVRGADGTLSGVWRNGGMRADISAVPGLYSPQPPAHLSGYTRYIRARSGGFWVRVAER